MVLDDDSPPGRRCDKGMTRVHGRPSGIYTLPSAGWRRLLSGRADRGPRDPAVAYVEQNRRLSPSRPPRTGATWGLDRIDQRNLPLNGTYTYAGDRRAA